MPSEKIRYMKARRGPDAPIESNDLLEQLRLLDKDSLSEIVWIRSQHDDLLRRALTALVAIRSSGGDFEKGKAAVDFGLHLPDFVTYDIEGGYGQILDCISSGIQYLADSSHHDCALRLAQYAVECAEATLERFAEGWEWQCAIERLTEFIEKLKTAGEPASST